AAMVGLIIIILSVLTGVFAYFIAPDNTPNADRQIVEIQAQHPGYKQLFLRVKKERVIAATGLFTQLLYGKEDAYNYFPINSYTVEGDSVIATKYIDE